MDPNWTLKFLQVGSASCSPDPVDARSQAKTGKDAGSYGFYAKALAALRLYKEFGGSIHLAFKWAKAAIVLHRARAASKQEHQEQQTC